MRRPPADSVNGPAPDAHEVEHATWHLLSCQAERIQFLVSEHVAAAFDVNQEEAPVVLRLHAGTEPVVIQLPATLDDLVRARLLTHTMLRQTRSQETVVNKYSIPALDAGGRRQALTRETTKSQVRPVFWHTPAGRTMSRLQDSGGGFSMTPAATG